MPKLPSYPMDGEPVEKTVIEIINYLRAVTIRSFIGGMVSVTPGGTTLQSAKEDNQSTSGLTGYVRITSHSLDSDGIGAPMYWGYFRFQNGLMTDCKPLETSMSEDIETNSIWGPPIFGMDFAGLLTGGNVHA